MSYCVSGHSKNSTMSRVPFKQHSHEDDVTVCESRIPLLFHHPLTFSIFSDCFVANEIIISHFQYFLIVLLQMIYNDDGNHVDDHFSAPVIRCVSMPHPLLTAKPNAPTPFMVAAFPSEESLVNSGKSKRQHPHCNRRS